jgi:hypothetical protein
MNTSKKYVGLVTRVDDIDGADAKPRKCLIVWSPELATEVPFRRIDDAIEVFLSTSFKQILLPLQKVE